MVKEITPPDPIPVPADSLSLKDDFCASVMDVGINRSTKSITAVLPKYREATTKEMDTRKDS